MSTDKESSFSRWGTPLYSTKAKTSGEDDEECEELANRLQVYGKHLCKLNVQVKPAGAYDSTLPSVQLYEDSGKISALSRLGVFTHSLGSRYTFVYSY